MGKVFGVNGSLAGLILRRTVPGKEQTSRSRPRGGEQKAILLWLEQVSKAERGVERVALQ